MSIVDDVFKKVRCDYEALVGYGFVKAEDVYIYRKEFVPDFEAVVSVSEKGDVSVKVLDKEIEEEFLGLDVLTQTGTFVSSIRHHLRVLLEDIKDKCFVPVLFESAQADRIAKAIADEYGDEPDFPFSKKPYEGAAVFRRGKSNKWYALFIRLPYKKLGVEIDGEVDIVDLKGDPKMIPELLKESGFYSAYHMNKTHWFTIALDDTADDAVIMSLVAASRESIGQRSKVEHGHKKMS